MLPWVENFMAETGCLVNLKDFADYDRAMELIAAGGIDVVVGGGSSGRLISEGIVDEIDTSRVPSWGTIDPQATSASWNSVDGEVYGVPYLWVPYVLMYNTDVFPTPPTSWDVVFEEQTLPDGKSNKGRVLAPYTAVYIGDAAKYLMSSKPEAGITDPYRLSSSQFSMALEQLYMQKGLLAAYWDYAEPMTDFAAKGYAATSAMPRVVKLMEEAGIPVASTIPQEGATASAFTNMLVKDAPHPVCAYQWMEYALDAKVQGDSAAAFGANPFVAAACEGASDSLSAEECERNGFSRFSEFSNLQLPTTDCGDGQNNCIPLDRWVQEFSALTNP
jgi:putative spermidine/putrescine transport system substrate-binding protein